MSNHRSLCDINIPFFFTSFLTKRTLFSKTKNIRILLTPTRRQIFIPATVLLLSLFTDLPNTRMDAIDWIHFSLRCYVQQSLAGTQIYHKTETRSKGKNKCFVSRENYGMGKYVKVGGL